jgi:hypothetical protein
LLPTGVVCTTAPNGRRLTSTRLTARRHRKTAHRAPKRDQPELARRNDQSVLGVLDSAMMGDGRIPGLDLQTLVGADGSRGQSRRGNHEASPRRDSCRDLLRRWRSGRRPGCIRESGCSRGVLHLRPNRWGYQVPRAGRVCARRYQSQYKHHGFTCSKLDRREDWHLERT